MFKLINRLAWVLAIVTTISIFAIDDDLFIIAIIAGLVIKFVILKTEFINSRLEYFANSIKENYIKDSKPSNCLDKKEEKVTEIFNPEKLNLNVSNIKEKEEILNLANIKEDTEINNDFNTLKEIEAKQKIEKLEVGDLKNSQNYTSYNTEPGPIEIFLNKIGDYIKEFFSTNLLAKLGGILVFLAVVYLLKGVFFSMGPVMKLTLGIIVGFAVYITGIKIHSKYENEGLILMGIGILINFAVILSGRYLVGDDGYLSETTTFLFLILNTVFAVLTSIIYKSKTLLIFSFIFAYLNPILTGGSSDTPYTLIGYSLIVSLGALYLSIKEANLTLLAISFIAGNLLFLFAPFSDSIGWSAKIIFTSILSIVSVIGTNKFSGLEHSTSKIIMYLFVGAYIFIVLNLSYSSTYIDNEYINVLSKGFSFIIYNLILFGLFVFSIKTVIQKNDGNSPLNIFLFFPILIIIGILFSGNMIFSPFVLVSTLITYLIGFIFLQNMSNIFSYIYFGILAIFILLFNLKIGIIDKTDSFEFITLIATSLIFLFSTYYYSRKENLSALFPIGTIGTILILSPIIVVNYKFLDSTIQNSAPSNILEFGFSQIAIIIFAIANLVLPFINKQLFKKENLNNLIIGSVAGALFFAFQIYNYGEIHFPGVTEGFAFLGLAIVYFMQGFFVGNKIGFEKMKTDENLKNSFYTFLAISISLFSVAMAFVFSKYPEIITTTWLFEATILYFFYSKTKNIKIFWVATILFIVGLSKFGILTTIVESKDYGFLISFGVILTSFMLNLFFVNKSKDNELHNFHHILHIIGMGIMGILLLEIIPSTGHGWSLFGISTFITLLGVFYAKFNFKLLKIVFLILIALFGILHIGELGSVFYKLQRDDLISLKILQYLVTLIVVSNYFIWNKINKQINYNKVLLIIISIYSFIISNLFVLDLFHNIFGYYTLTIYWGLIASGLLIYGILNDVIKFRTIGLYFLTLTSIKIFLYDVWQISDTNSRVIVFAILGVIFIIISTLYSKRFGNNMKGEFSLNNLKDNTNTKIDDSNKDNSNTLINSEIDNINVSEYKGVKFKFNNGKTISIRSENLIKISKLITENKQKSDFKANELKSTYEYITNNYKSSISPSNYKKILEVMEKFVKYGGEVEFIKK